MFGHNTTAEMPNDKNNAHRICFVRLMHKLVNLLSCRNVDPENKDPAI